MSEDLMVRMITQEAVRLFRNARWYWDELTKIWGYDWHIREWLIATGIEDED